MADLALYYGHDYDPTALKAGDGLGPVYTNWENAAMLTCKCDYGFFGPDCSISKYPSVYILYVHIYVVIIIRVVERCNQSHDH